MVKYGQNVKEKADYNSLTWENVLLGKKTSNKPQLCHNLILWCHKILKFKWKEQSFLSICSANMFKILSWEAEKGYFRGQ